jgi:streptomycin 6-kinase
MSTSIPIDVPDALIASQLKHGGPHGRAWIASLPRLIADVMDRWTLRLDGQALHGMASLVLPVLCADGTAAALKLQSLDEENVGEPIGLRAWDGAPALRSAHRNARLGSATSDRLDPRRTAERIMGHRGWRHRARPDPNRHRFGPVGSCPYS